MNLYRSYMEASTMPAFRSFNACLDPGRAVPSFVAAVLSALVFAAPAAASEPMDARIAALVPEIEATIARGMTAFDSPGLAIGIVTGDRLVYAKGFGVRRKGGEPVDTATVFQIGSATKPFLATTMAIVADRGKFAWDDRVVDLYPDFQLKDPWVTREFRVFDLAAQRSGLPPYVNDMVGLLGGDQQAMIHSLRFVEPVSSFRSTFAYTNITHILAQRIVAKQLGAEDWNAVVRTEIFEPLGMKDSSLTAEAIEAAANHASGHRWTPAGAIEVPFTPSFPYEFGGAGAINSNVDDMARWLRLHLANGVFEGKRLVSAENLAFTRTPKVGVSDTISYALGWAIRATPNGRVIWHSGSTDSFGAYAGFLPDKDVGVVVLTNEIQCRASGCDRRVAVRPHHGKPGGRQCRGETRRRQGTVRDERKALRQAREPAPPPSARPSRRRFRQPGLRQSQRSRGERRAYRCVRGDRRQIEACALGWRDLHRRADARKAGLRPWQPISARSRSASSSFRRTRPESSTVSPSPSKTAKPTCSCRNSAMFSPNSRLGVLRDFALAAPHPI